jgi:uncharacterized protein YbgA (DUF1722 family)
LVVVMLMLRVMVVVVVAEVVVGEGVQMQNLVAFHVRACVLLLTFSQVWASQVRSRR